MKCVSYLNGILPFCQLDDDEFSLALFELINGTVHFTEDRLFSLKFNPLLSEHRSLALCSDLDPDLNFFYDSNESDYYTEDQFNNQFLKKMPNTQCLSFLHLNIRNEIPASLRNKTESTFKRSLNSHLFTTLLEQDSYILTIENINFPLQ